MTKVVLGIKNRVEGRQTNDRSRTNGADYDDSTKPTTWVQAIRSETRASVTQGFCMLLIGRLTLSYVMQGGPILTLHE